MLKPSRLLSQGSFFIPDRWKKYLAKSLIPHNLNHTYAMAHAVEAISSCFFTSTVGKQYEK